MGLCASADERNKDKYVSDKSFRKGYNKKQTFETREEENRMNLRNYFIITRFT